MGGGTRALPTGGDQGHPLRRRGSIADCGPANGVPTGRTTPRPSRSGRVRRALVDVGAVDPVALEAAVAGAGERARDVGAGGVGAAVLRPDCALVDVGAGLAIAAVAAVAGAGEGARGVGAGGVVVAVVGPDRALVDVGASDPVALVSYLVAAAVASGGVGAGGVGIAVVGVRGALVDVGARLAGGALTTASGSHDPSHRREAHAVQPPSATWYRARRAGSSYGWSVSAGAKRGFHAGQALALRGQLRAELRVLPRLRSNLLVQLTYRVHKDRHQTLVVHAEATVGVLHQLREVVDRSAPSKQLGWPSAVRPGIVAPCAHSR